VSVSGIIGLLSARHVSVKNDCISFILRIRKLGSDRNDWTLDFEVR